MNYKSFRKMIASILALSILSVPCLSLADGDYNPVLFHFAFNENHGGTGATSYTLAELATSTGVNVVPLTEGDNIIIEQASSGSWAQPAIKLTAVPTERHMVGFNVPLAQTIKTGKLSIDYSVSGMGGLSQRRYPIIMNGSIPIFSHETGTWSLHTSASSNTSEISYFHDKEFVFERASEDEDWTVNVQYPGWNNWQTFTVSKEYLPEITAIGAGSDLIPENNEQSINLRFNRYKVTYYPYPALEVTSNVAVDADIKVKSQMALNPTAFADASLSLKKLEGGAPVGEALPATVTLESDGKTITIASNDYLEPNSAYRVAISNLTDTAGNIYTCNRDFATVTDNIELSAAPVFTYKDSEGNVVTQESATSVTANVSVTNGGGSRNLMASLLVLNSSGVLQKVAVNPFTLYSEANIPLEVTLTGATLSGMTVNYKIFEKLQDGKIVEVK